MKMRYPTVYTADSNYNVTEIDYPNNTTDEITYNTNGTISTKTNEDNKVIHYVYSTAIVDQPSFIVEPLNSDNSTDDDDYSITDNVYNPDGTIDYTFSFEEDCSEGFDFSDLSFYAQSAMASLPIYGSGGAVFSGVNPSLPNSAIYYDSYDQYGNPLNKRIYIQDVTTGSCYISNTLYLYDSKGRLKKNDQSW